MVFKQGSHIDNTVYVYDRDGEYLKSLNLHMKSYRKLMATREG